MFKHVKDKHLQILVVEDNPADSYLIEEAFGRQDTTWRTVTISNGDAAIEYLADHRPDIAVLDLNVPGRDGVEILQFIREELRLSEVVVIIFSSSPVDAIERKAPQADAHIQKPFDLDQFLNIGEKISYSYQQARQQRMSS